LKLCSSNQRIILERGVEGWELEKNSSPRTRNLEGGKNIWHHKKSIEISSQRNKEGCRVLGSSVGEEGSGG